jgi:Flp pilus assembly protein TadB
MFFSKEKAKEMAKEIEKTMEATKIETPKEEEQQQQKKQKYASLFVTENKEQERQEVVHAHIHTLSTLVFRVLFVVCFVLFVCIVLFVVFSFCVLCGVHRFLRALLCLNSEKQAISSPLWKIKRRTDFSVLRKDKHYLILQDQPQQLTLNQEKAGG